MAGVHSTGAKSAESCKTHKAQSPCLTRVSGQRAGCVQGGQAGTAQHGPTGRQAGGRRRPAQRGPRRHAAAVPVACGHLEGQEYQDGGEARAKGAGQPAREADDCRAQPGTKQGGAACAHANLAHRHACIPCIPCLQPSLMERRCGQPQQLGVRTREEGEAGNEEAKRADAPPHGQRAQHRRLQAGPRGCVVPSIERRQGSQVAPQRASTALHPQACRAAAAASCCAS